mmetsp:Transcript_82280/g.145832  ORF Transcript_82280/g.145832 Transcript_82280/m.145832 type:complete len:509 (-) Transcript_82280:43-1569(-)
MVSYALNRFGPWRGPYFTILALLVLHLSPVLGKRRLTIGEIEGLSSSGASPISSTGFEKSNVHQRTRIKQPHSHPNSAAKPDIEAASSDENTQKGHLNFSASSRAFTHMVVAAGALVLAVVFYLRSGLPAASFIKSEDDPGEVVGCEKVAVDCGDSSTQKLRSLACLVCCWAMCHLSIPSLLLLGKQAQLPAHTDGSMMSLVNSLLIAMTAVLGGMVYDRWGHSAAVMYGVAIISPLCIVVEQLSLNGSAGVDEVTMASRLVSLLIPVTMGAMLTWHVSAMMMAFSLFERVYVAPLSFLLAAGVIEGSSHLDRLLDDEPNHTGGGPLSAGFFGLIALKFASIGLLVCLQGSVFSADAQRLPRRVLPGKSFACATLQNLASPKVFFLVFGQVLPIGIASVKAGLDFRRGRLAAAQWEAMATLWSASAWGVLIPAYVYSISPEFCQGVITATCVALLGVVSHMDAQFIGHGLSAWPPERLCVTITLFGTTIFILVSGRAKEVFKAKKAAV